MIYDELNKLETSIKVHGYNIYHGDDDVDYICSSNGLPGWISRLLGLSRR